MHFTLWWVGGAIVLYIWHRKFVRIITGSQLPNNVAATYRTVHLAVAFVVWLSLCALISIGYLIMDVRAVALWVWGVFDLVSGIALVGLGYLLLVVISARIVHRGHRG